MNVRNTLSLLKRLKERKERNLNQELEDTKNRTMEEEYAKVEKSKAYLQAIEELRKQESKLFAALSKVYKEKWIDKNDVLYHSKRTGHYLEWNYRSHVADKIKGSFDKRKEQLRTLCDEIEISILTKGCEDGELQELFKKLEAI